MYARSSLSQAQRDAAVALFEEGSGRAAVATQLGVSRDPVKALYDRWRVRGTGALVTKPDKETCAFEVKLDVVQRFLAGDRKVELAKEFGLSSPQLIGSWVRKYHGICRSQPAPPPTQSLPNSRGSSSSNRLSQAHCGPVLAVFLLAIDDGRYRPICRVPDRACMIHQTIERLVMHECL